MYSTSPSRWTPLLLLLTLQQHVLHVVSQQIYIDKVPGYASLTACAQWPVSSIVRAQASGCGDNNALTSYSCFCYASSAAFAAIISTAVVENCTQPTPTPEAEASSAVAVFSSYCQLGAALSINSTNATSTRTSTTKSGTFVSVSKTSSLPNQTGVAAASSSAIKPSGGSGGLGTGGGIGVGLVIGLVVAGFGFGLFLLRKRSLRRHAAVELPPDNEKQGANYQANKAPPQAGWKSESSTTTELPSQKEPPLTELPEKDRPEQEYELA